MAAAGIKMASARFNWSLILFKKSKTLDITIICMISMLFLLQFYVFATQLTKEKEMPELNVTLKGQPLTGLKVGAHKVYGSADAIAALQAELKKVPKKRAPRAKKKTDEK